ncbi:MAG: hypothetical protein E7671_02380 [Ruminococcaceae bacterium]|nr:hypothetical protein [Oscillospiraceae bacterium]
MKNEYEFTLRMNAEMMKKFLFVSEKEGRTPNNQFLFMLRNNVAYYEKTKGKIKPADLAQIDLSDYEN